MWLATKGGRGKKAPSLKGTGGSPPSTVAQKKVRKRKEGGNLRSWDEKEKESEKNNERGN